MLPDRTYLIRIVMKPGRTGPSGWEPCRLHGLRFAWQSSGGLPESRPSMWWLLWLYFPRSSGKALDIRVTPGMGLSKRETDDEAEPLLDVETPAQRVGWISLRAREAFSCRKSGERSWIPAKGTGPGTQFFLIFPLTSNGFAAGQILP